MAEPTDEELYQKYKQDKEFQEFCKNMQQFFLRAQWAETIYRDGYNNEDLLQYLRLNPMFFDKDKGLDVFLEEPWPSILSGKAGICQLIQQIEAETGRQPETAAQLCQSDAFKRFLEGVMAEQNGDQIQTNNNEPIPRGQDQSNVMNVKEVMQRLFFSEDPINQLDDSH